MKELLGSVSHLDAVSIEQLLSQKASRSLLSQTAVLISV